MLTACLVGVWAVLAVAGAVADRMQRHRSLLAQLYAVAAEVSYTLLIAALVLVDTPPPWMAWGLLGLSLVVAVRSAVLLARHPGWRGVRWRSERAAVPSGLIVRRTRAEKEAENS